MTKPANRCGFTLIDIVLAAAIIGLLAFFIVPAAGVALRNRQNARAAGKLRTAVAAFEMYRSETGSYPADRTPGVIPPEIAVYFTELNISDWWIRPTELGGGWDWDNGYNFKYSVSISNPSRTGQMTEFDQLVDDGNLSTGNFRKVGTQYHYILER